MAATASDRASPPRIVWTAVVLLLAVSVGAAYLRRAPQCPDEAGGGARWWQRPGCCSRGRLLPGHTEVLWLLAATCTLALGAGEALADAGRPARTAIRDPWRQVSLGLYTLMCCQESHGLHHLNMVLLILASVLLPVGGLL